MSKPLIATRIDQRTYDYLKAIEKGSGSAISDIIRRALRVYLKTYKSGKILEPLEPQPEQK
jgi:hypothetical protein